MARASWAAPDPAYPNPNPVRAVAAEVEPGGQPEGLQAAVGGEDELAGADGVVGAVPLGDVDDSGCVHARDVSASELCEQHSASRL